MRLLTRLFIYFLSIGVFLTLLAYFHFLYPNVLFICFITICILFVILLLSFFIRLQYLSRFELLLSYLLMCIWTLHFLQVLVPETGFDALWYHFPVVNQIYKVHGLMYIPHLYQSVNPLFSDLYFLTGFAVMGDAGAKFIAYIFGVFLVAAVYALSRIFLARKTALSIAVIVSTFQVISWQSSSFYVDVAKAFFEVAGLVILLYATLNSTFNTTKQHALSLLFFSASLATKVFSILLLPVIFLIICKKQFFSIRIVLYLLCLFSIPGIYYWFAYQNVGNPLYSVVVHTDKLAEIGGTDSSMRYVLQRIISLPTSLTTLMLTRDYVYPLLPLFIFPIWLQISKVLSDARLRVLLLFSVNQWLIWWFVPPLSTRYALSGFITLLILGVAVTRKKYFKTRTHENRFLIILIVCAVLAIFPRIIVAKRSLTYILTDQSRQEYLQQFYDGSVDDKINAWYGYSKLLF